MTEQSLASDISAAIDRTTAYIRQAIDSYDRTIALGLGLGAGFAALLRNSPHSEFLVALPFLFLVLLIFALTRLAELRTQAGYQAFLEERLNAIHGSAIFTYQSKIAPQMGHRYRIPPTILILLVVAAFAFSILVASSVVDGVPRAIVVFSASALGLAAAVSGWIEQHRAYKKAYQVANAAYELHAGIGGGGWG